MIDQIGFMHFGAMHYFFWAMLTLMVVITMIAGRWYRSIQALRLIGSEKIRSLLLKNGSSIRRILKFGALLIGFIGLLLAVLAPECNQREELVTQKGRDILIAVDISRSMMCSDLKPNRLEYAKQKIKKILYNLQCDRVGLIIFAGEAVVQCPLTSDYSAFLMFLESLNAQTISSGTTAIDKAIRSAVGVFAAHPQRKTKILCILTDGEDFSTNLSGIKEKAAAENIKIYTFGLGSARGAPIPIINHQGVTQGFEKDSKGVVIMSKLSEDVLKQLSTATGGQYIAVSADERDVAQFVQLVHAFEKDSMADQKLARYEQQYPYFVMVSFICFMLEWLL